MKSMKSIIVATALVFWACSEEKNTTGVWVDDPSIAFGDSSSSSENEKSSSSRDISSVDISGFGDAPIVFPPEELCEPLPPNEVKSAPMVHVSLIKEDEHYGVIPAITRDRVKVLVSEGLTLDSAIAQARGELFKELGLDTLLEETSIRESSLERTLYYLYQGRIDQDWYDDEISMAADFADGKLDADGDEELAEAYCILSNSSYGGLEEAYVNFMPLGCYIPGYMYSEPYAILSNIKRKCDGLPYCDKDHLGMFSADSAAICRKDGWRDASPIERETMGRLCENQGEYFLSPLDSTRAYICRANKEWDSVSTLQAETYGKRCKYDGYVLTSSHLSNVVYVCRNSPYGPWEIASDFDMEVASIPCDEIGKMVASSVKPDSFHICKEKGWATATLLEMDTMGHVCELEGNRFDSPRVPGLSYVCHEGEWKKFYETSCTKNNERKLVTNEEASWIQSTYICYEGKWYSSVEWTTDLPYEYYFNPDIDYGSFKDPRDGRVYRTVEYRGVTWMSENMKYYDPTDVHLKGQIACLEDGCANTGYYYSSAAADYVCPEGWTLLDTAIIRNITDYAEYRYYEHYYSSIAKIGSAYNYKDDYGLSFLATGLIAGENLDQPGWLGYATMFWLTEIDETNVHYIGNVKPGHEPGPTKFEDVWGVTTTNMHLPIRCIKK